MSSKSDKNGASKGAKPLSKSEFISQVFNKAITKNSAWPDTEEFLDVIYWGRQILGIALGLLWGLFAFKGFIALALFCIVSSGVVYAYALNYQAVDEDDFGGVWEIVKEGFMGSFASFLVIWILIYSAVHFDDWWNYYLKKIDYITFVSRPLPTRMFPPILKENIAPVRYNGSSYLESITYRYTLFVCTFLCWSAFWLLILFKFSLM